ncbi:MAG: RagB/SusD family nutrient uptake outer membrane protein [Bacteroides sp.]|jgi:hypothetical protein|uniref:RagB/SusD domain-containing protein n=1 Tax=Phocaeicola sartorii TaxID=671267 RepID=R9IDB1_9BACT|nr:RagB/SusD family nutrient uptake outer membrane protein [Phocaeicola sartorii]MBO5507242.1 RagB/SusD family nutrient uptake outer membrane protein [Bacteroides sp.]EOS16443.1 hypothetical protein C802_00122 [Phocaeicola sartorii]MCR1844350.1 RagB/SusD family nutrient uptake outer membrane protein [Phocaeicola sartorii]NBH66451.1 RagB/SusD family nutrient uptake outer membrane protein [Phocaeicola sartorii]NUK97821.1 RagB/SusD family nutrient uptake outer membrane protein [Phocaeicola sartor
MKYKYLLAGVGFMALMSSCEFTDISPKDSLTDKSYWGKAEDLKLYANNLYTMFPGPDYNLDSQSDDCVSTTANATLFDDVTVPGSGGGWSWGNIRICNFFLNRYHTAVGSESEINRYVAEVRFFRALDYFSKVKSFGDVPWYESDLKADDKELLYKARDPRNFVIGKIIEDLEFAAQWLPTPDKAGTGRLHKYVAYTQLSRVCLYEGTHMKYHNESGSITSQALLEKAVKAAEAVMASGLYDIVKATDAGCGQQAFEGYPLYYGNLFIQEDLTGNKECILPRIYIKDLLMHWLGRDYAKKGLGYSKDFLETFLFRDGKPISAHKEYDDATLEKELADRDPRMYQIINNPHRPTLIDLEGVHVWESQNIAPNQGVSGYNLTKYLSPIPDQNEANSSTYDWFLYRYAEVLLNYAEAKAELGTCTQADLDKTVNLLRDRVEMAHLSINPVVDNSVDYGYSISPLLYEIRRERRVELATEGFRWSDIVRWKAGKLLENPKTYLGMTLSEESMANYPEGTFDGRKVTIGGKTYLKIYEKALDDAGRKWSANDKRYLNPLPTDQLVLNKNLTQNPGWEE